MIKIELIYRKIFQNILKEFKIFKNRYQIYNQVEQVLVL